MRTYSSSQSQSPSLTAILLVTQSRAGPRLVFHYPAVPSPPGHPAKRDPSWFGTPRTTTDESGGEGDDWDDDGDSVSSREDQASSRAGSVSGSVPGSRGSRVRSSGLRSRATAGLSRDVDEERIETDVEEDGEDGLAAARGGSQHPLPEWEKLLGFSAGGLSALLSPSRHYNKKRFEVGVDQHVFVGAPMFVRDDGYWKKRRRRRKKKDDDGGDETHPESVDVRDMIAGRDRAANARPLLSPIADQPAAQRVGSLERVPIFDAAYGHGLMSGAASVNGSDTSAAADQRDMTMFNVVFVLNPPSLEYHMRVDEMYEFIVKRFAKDLKLEQARSDWVSEQAHEILKLKESGKEKKDSIFALWPRIVSQSSLAKAIAVTYDSLAENKIAHIDLNGYDTSFQIPQPVSTPFLPTPAEPQMPGLWLTTATLVDEEDPDAGLTPNAALLLLEDDDALLREIESDLAAYSGPLASFVRKVTPTKSLSKLSNKYLMPLKDVQILASHLIYWRRARAIPPLHWRHIYVVSPNADMRTLETAIPAFAACFPTMPPLPKILQMLSGPPRSFRSHMPSLDHRTVYMDILAWLMRGGWVIQLRSFAWVRVSPEVKAAVAAKLNREMGSASMEVQVEPAMDGTNTHHTRENSEVSIVTQVQRSPLDKAPSEPHPSPHLSPYRNPAAPASDAGSASSSRTAVLAALSPLQRPQSRAIQRPSPLQMHHSATPVAEAVAEPLPPSPSQASTAHLISDMAGLGGLSNFEAEPPDFRSENPADYEATLIYSPQSATHEEKAWLEHLSGLVPTLYPAPSEPNGHASRKGDPVNGRRRRVSGEERSRDAAPAADAGQEARELWPVLLKHLDGRNALEEISAREGLKKGKVRDLVGRLTRAGWIVIVRHW